MNPFFDLKFQEKRLLDNINLLSKSDREKVVGAYNLAKKYHSGQKRDEGGPYILHCLRIASYLIEILSMDNVDVICAALLHDAVEDTELELSEVKRRFGKRVSQLVDNLTRKKLPDETELNRYQWKYRSFLETMKKDLNTRSIKACDWLDNITSWPKFPKNHPSCKKFPRWLKEMKTMYIPLAKSVDPKLVKKMNEALSEVKRTLGNKL